MRTYQPVYFAQKNRWGLLTAGILITVFSVACNTAPLQTALQTALRTASPPATQILATRIIETHAPPTPSRTPFAAVTPSPTALPPTATIPPSPTPLASVGRRSADDPYAPTLGNTGYDVQRYSLQLSLDPSNVFVDAATTIEAISERHNLVQISLDFAGFEIMEVTMDGIPADFTREADKLIIDLSQPLTSGELFSLRVVYNGAPTTSPSPYVPFFNHLGLQFLGDSLFVVAEPDGAHYWFPSNNHPRDKAAFRFKVTVPEGLTAAANGLLVKTIPGNDGTTTFIWEHDYPMAPYLATVAVGDYERLETTSPNGVLLRHYVFPDLREEFERTTSITGEALDWMSDLFGPYPFEAFGYATIRQVSAALETQTMVVITEHGLNEETMIHELAHMWFGDWVSLESWADVWRNEGFATYVTLMWQTRDDPEGLNIYMENVTANIAANDSGEPLGNLPPQRLFGFDSYWKGAVLIHALRLEVGDDAFFNGLWTFFERYGGGTASQNEFQGVMEEVSGMDLDAFFATWLK